VKTGSKASPTVTAPAGKSRLLLAVDGGGSKTLALIASFAENGDIHVLGRGHGGPSNLMLAGKEQSLASLDQAIDEALADTDRSGQNLDCAVLALAGSTSPDVQRDVSDWAQQRRLSPHMEIVHDADPVLASGTENGWGVALIVGTGSVAVGLDATGNSVTKGGWGHWFGDKGSGFYLGYKALAAVAEASDDIGPETILSELVMERLGTTDPRSILEEVSAGGDTRREVAALAPVVMSAAEQQDSVAIRIIISAVTEAVKLVAAVTRTLEFDSPYPLAVAGGVVCNSELFQRELMNQLGKLEPAPGNVKMVDEPVMGCLIIGRKKLES
jgi:N-acetylglucosamine kinase-like BadF-type ATPase